MLKRLIAGECSLRATFWGFGVLGFFLFILLTSLTQNTFLQILCSRNRICGDVNIVYFTFSNFIQLLLRGGTTAIYLVLHLIMSGCFVAYMIMVLRGLWKCTQKNESKKFWAWCAKILLLCLVVLGLRTIL
jgi:hypothetical protein